MFAGNPRKTELPHARGNFMLLKPLSGAELDEAENANTTKLLQLAQSVQGLDLEALRGNPTEKPEDAEPDPAAPYDDGVVLAHGVRGWEGPSCKDIPYSREALEQLDKPTREWAVRTIVEMSVRPPAPVGGSA